MKTLDKVASSRVPEYTDVDIPLTTNYFKKTKQILPFMIPQLILCKKVFVNIY